MKCGEGGNINTDKEGKEGNVNVHIDTMGRKQTILIIIITIIIISSLSDIMYILILDATEGSRIDGGGGTAS